MTFKHLVFSISTLLLSSALMAEDVSFRASAPSQVIAGQPFQLTYTINCRARDLRAPEFTGFDYLAGPYTSQSSSTSFVNGKRSSSFTLTYTYTLRALQDGTYTIGPATIHADGDDYTSNGVRITVLPPDEPQEQVTTSREQGTRNQERQQTSNEPAYTQDNASADNLFIRTIVSKTRVHEQEALTLAYKLYFAGVDVAQFTNNTRLPEFTGFLKQDFEQGEIQTELEHYNGRNYQTAVLYRTLLYPQHSGDIKIDPASFEAVLRVATRAQVRSIFDDFFGSYTNVTKGLTAPGVTIHVDALPVGKPAGFSGGVGHFAMQSSISSTSLQANEAVTIKLVIQGSGNMKLVKTPDIDWPEGFETYDPKVTNNFKTSASGMSGTKTIEYLAIPRAGGDYIIPAVQFSYFDIQDNAYKTLMSDEYTLHIARGLNEDNNPAVVQNYVNKEDIKQLGTDIRFIHSLPVSPVDTMMSAPSSHSSLLIYGPRSIALFFLLPLFAAIVLFIIFRKRIRENADITRVKYKKANKIVQKRLKVAKKLLTGNQKEAFYEEIERAAWQYLSDRLSIPTADLSKDNIADLLRRKNVREDLIREVTDVLTTAEFARYAPSDGNKAMDELYDRTAELINQLENQRI